MQHLRSILEAEFKKMNKGKYLSVAIVNSVAGRYQSIWNKMANISNNCCYAVVLNKFTRSNGTVTFGTKCILRILWILEAEFKKMNKDKYLSVSIVNSVAGRYQGMWNKMADILNNCCYAIVLNKFIRGNGTVTFGTNCILRILWIQNFVRQGLVSCVYRHDACSSIDSKENGVYPDVTIFRFINIA